jgi:hypothetical protein
MRRNRRTRYRDAGLPSIIAAWQAGEPPPDLGRPLTDDEADQRASCVFFGDHEGARLRVSTDHPHLRAWLDWKR